MIKTHKFNLLGLSILCVCLSFNFALSQSLEDTITNALKNSDSLKASSFEWAALNEVVNQSSAGTEIRGEISSSIQEGKSGTFQSLTNDTHNNSLTLSLSKSIFDGGKSKTLKDQAMLRIEQKKIQIKILEQSIILDSISKHLNTFVFFQTMKLREKNLKKIEKEVKSNELKFNIGAINKSVIFQSNAKLAKAKAELVESEINYQNSLSEYISLTGIENVKLSFPVIPEIIPTGAVEAVNKSESQSYNIELSKIQISLKQAEYRSLVSSVMPTLSSSISSSISDTVSGNHKESVSLSLSFKSPIFYTPATLSKNRQIASEISALNYELNKKIKDTKLNAKLSYEKFIASKELIKASKEELEAIKISSEIITIENKLGSKTILDVLDSELNTINAEISLLRNKSNSVISAYTLLSVIGELDTANLGLKPTAPHYNKIELLVPNLPSPINVLNFINDLD